MKQAIGIIEVLGFATVIEVADVCVKTANVRLEGYEKSTGGWGIVKISGDVGAVKAAVSSGISKAKDFGQYIASTVIARPADGLDSIIRKPKTEDNISRKKEVEEAEKTVTDKDEQKEVKAEIADEETMQKSEKDTSPVQISQKDSAKKTAGAKKKKSSK